MANLTLADLQARSNGEAESNETPDKGTFLAPNLTLVVMDPEGNELGAVELEARAFNTKEKKGKMQGGIGWYASPQRKDGISFRGLPLSGGLRFSVDRLKIGPGDVVDIRTDSEK